MEDLHIKGTSKTLKISCKKGLIEFNGRSILNDPHPFFKPVKEWIDEYIKAPESETTINCKFDYIDTSTFKNIYILLKEFEQIRGNNKVKVNWYVENNDPEIMELGNILENRIEITFEIVHII